MNDRPPFPEVIDATMMNDWRACKHLFLRSHLQHWRPQGESVHLHFGACFAAGIEAARRAYYEHAASADDSLAAGIRAFMEAWGDFEPPPGSAKTLERGVGALEFYLAEWPFTGGAQPHILASGKSAIEFSFSQPLPFLHPITEQPLIYCGRADAIMDFAGGIYLEDDKTASQLGESWAKQWELRGQFTGYCWAAREIGIDVNGVLVRGVSILKTKYGAAQAITYRSAAEIDEWLAVTVSDLGEMVTNWKTSEWKKNFGDSCSSYGGCQFVPVCKSADPDTWLKVYFEQIVWDPLERTKRRLHT